MHPLSFTSSAMKWLVERWAVRIDDFATKPWTITFETPPQIQTLDTISLTIPSEALRNMLVHINTSKDLTLCEAMKTNLVKLSFNDACQTNLAKTEEGKEIRISIPKQNKVQHEDANRALLFDEQQHHLLPVVEAVQHFILESFGINVASFKIVKLSTALVTISEDGRFKVTQYDVLEGIRDIAMAHREHIMR
jgi:hypothetical protein